MIATTTTKAVYLGNGVTREFPIPFEYADKRDVKVRLYDIALNRETEVLTGFWVNEAERMVVYPGYAPGQEPPAEEQPPVLTDGYKLIVCRETPVQQLTNLGGKYPLPVLEQMIDRNTMIAQEASERISRCVMVDMGAGLSSWEAAKRFFLGVEQEVRQMTESVRQMKAYIERIQIDAQHVDEALQQATENAQRATESARQAEIAARKSNSALEKTGVRVLERSKRYAVGDIACSKSLPSWARLECVKAGTTAETEPMGFTQVSSGGVLITDGTVVWIVDDVRDGTPVGAVRGALYLSPGYVKANGATVQRADYPRLVALVERHNLWTDDVTANAGLFGRGDGVATMVLPNWTDRMMQLATDRIGASVAAGLPNIEGGFSSITSDGSQGIKAVRVRTYYNSRMQSLGHDDNWGKVWDFDASRANPIYGASSTVQPPAIALIAQIKY